MISNFTFSNQYSVIINKKKYIKSHKIFNKLHKLTTMLYIEEKLEEKYITFTE